MKTHRHPHRTSSEQREQGRIAYLSAKANADQSVADLHRVLDALSDEAPRLDHERRAFTSLVRACVALARTWVRAHSHIDLWSEWRAITEGGRHGSRGGDQTPHGDH
jgi:hypothetical protein